MVEALKLTIRKEGLIPALESSHAFAQAFKEVGTLSPSDVILINQSGRGDKDIFTDRRRIQRPAVGGLHSEEGGGLPSCLSST